MSSHTHLRPAVWRRTAAAFAAAVCLGASSVASAALFEDDEARRAILELRQQRLNADRLAEEQRPELSQLRRSLLDLQTQIETLRGEIARLHGQNGHARVIVERGKLIRARRAIAAHRFKKAFQLHLLQTAATRREGEDGVG